jgi:hypothetical protein
MSNETNSLAEMTTNPVAEEQSTAGTNQDPGTDTNEVDDVASNEPSQDEEGQEETTDDGEEPSSKKPKRGFDKRIAKEISRRTQAQQEAEYWKKVALERGTAPQSTAVDTQQAPKPKFSDYNDIEAYTEAVTEWKMEQKLQATLQQRDQQNAQKTLEQSYNQRVQEFVKQKPDFADVLAASDLQISKPVTELIFESEVGPAIAYYLAENEEETERINRMSPARQLAEIGKIEAKLATPVVKEKKRVSQAPAPVKPVQGGAPVAAKSLDDPNLSPEDWIKLRNKARRFR